MVRAKVTLRMIDLQAGRYPYIEDTKINHSNDDCSPYHDHLRTSTIGDDDSDPVDDNLQKQLHLYAPPKY
jgi:hypothetical protein